MTQNKNANIGSNQPNEKIVDLVKDALKMRLNDFKNQIDKKDDAMEIKGLI